MVNNKCGKCGAEIPEDSKFCVDCGTKVRNEGDEQINRSNPVTQDEAQNILRTRFAKGEITKKEYKKKKKVLQK